MMFDALSTLLGGFVTQCACVCVFVYYGMYVIKTWQPPKKQCALKHRTAHGYEKSAPNIEIVFHVNDKYVKPNIDSFEWHSIVIVVGELSSSPKPYNTSTILIMCIYA